jgi:hypothetical protein
MLVSYERDCCGEFDGALKIKACHVFAAAGSPIPYAAFFCCALTFAHRARCAAAIFLRADADMVRSRSIMKACHVLAAAGPPSC